MFQARLISEGIRDKSTPDNILKEFINGMKWINNQLNLKKHCKNKKCMCHYHWSIDTIYSCFCKNVQLTIIIIILLIATCMYKIIPSIS